MNSWNVIVGLAFSTSCLGAAVILESVPLAEQRPGVIVFDASAIPPGSVVTGAALRLMITDIEKPGSLISLHRNLGADVASANTQVDGPGVHIWNSPQTALDVQSWVDTSAHNHGWAIEGGVAFAPTEPLESGAPRFSGAGPFLIVEYQPPCPGDLNGDRVVSAADLTLLLGGFGTDGPGLRADQNSDGRADGSDLDILLGAFGSGCE